MSLFIRLQFYDTTIRSFYCFNCFCRESVSLNFNLCRYRAISQYLNQIVSTYKTILNENLRIN